MKSIIRNILIDSLIVFFMSQMFSGFTVNGGMPGFFLSGIFLSLGMTIGKPIIMLITIPLAIITFGLYNLISSFVATAIVFFGISILSHQFIINSFTTSPVTIGIVHVPALPLNYFFAFLFVVICYSLLKGVIIWLMEE